ncbi:hypothetical protein BGZ95_004051, partial [Linnemannia exigua]
LVQKILLIEGDLARLRLEQKVNANGEQRQQRQQQLQQLIPLRAPLILTPPVDNLSPPISTANRWATSEGAAASTWGFMNDSAAYPSPHSTHPSSSSLHDRPSIPSTNSYSDAASLSGSNISSDGLTGMTLALPAPLPPPPPTPIPTTTTTSNSPHSIPLASSLNRTLSPLSSSYESVGGMSSSYLCFHPGELSSNSRPSSPDSFNSALSSFPLDPPHPELAATAPPAAVLAAAPGLTGPASLGSVADLGSSEPSAL